MPESTGFIDIDKAISTRAAGLAALYVGETQLYVQEIHQQKTAVIDEAFTTTLDTIAETTAGEMEAARSDLARFDLPRDPVALLSGADLVRAGALATFVEQDVAALGKAELAARIQAAIADVDRVQMILLLRYVGQRLEREREEQAASGLYTAPHSNQLHGAIEALKAAVVDAKTAAKRKTIQDRFDVAYHKLQAVNNLRPGHRADIRRRFGI